MKIFKTLNIGDFHTNHCEDFWIVESIGSNEKLIAVLDGCTMGTESVFASILTGKILRKIAKRHFYQDFIESQSINLKHKLKEIVKELFSELRLAKNTLDLETNELLSTLIIGTIETNNRNAEIMTVGDGVVFCDGELTEYEQNNKPDYLAYHLDEDFDTWFDKQNQRLSYEGFRDLSICTDGIFTFMSNSSSDNQLSEGKIIDYLLKDATGSDHNNMLDKKIRHLYNEHNLKVTDDLAIIRLMASINN